jgi:protein TonB
MTFGKYRNAKSMKSTLLPLSLLASALLLGCSSSSTVTLNPVENRLPPLRVGVYAAKAVDSPPAPTSRSRLIFPAELRATGIDGKAVVTFIVRADGSVADPVVLNANDVRFGEAAKAAILKWRFRPAILAGAAVDCRMTLPFSFLTPRVGSAVVNTPSADPAEAIYGRIQPTEPR